MFQKMRRWWKCWYGFEFTFFAARCAAALILGIICLVAVVCRGEFDQVLPLLGGILPIVAIAGFGYWVYRDAKQTGKELRTERRRAGRKVKPQADGDMSEVAGMAPANFWGAK